VVVEYMELRGEVWTRVLVLADGTTVEEGNGTSDGPAIGVIDAEFMGQETCITCGRQIFR